MQSIEVIARTFENKYICSISNKTAYELNYELNKDLTILAGKAAGVCYMPDDYFEDGIQNTEKAFTREINTSKNGHHSVFEHGHVTMIIKTNKMIAMILNSTGVYSTSEKSARYTKMKPETELEAHLYKKWIDRIQSLILNEYPDFDDEILSNRLCKKLGLDNKKIIQNGKCVHLHDEKILDSDINELKSSETIPSYKLAQENARYMISVFTPTVLQYTISFRQLFLLINYFEVLEINCTKAQDNFSKQLLNSIIEFKNLLKGIVREQRINDNKNQYFRFLEGQHIGEIKNNTIEIYEDLDLRLNKKREYIGDSYTVTYNGSLAMLAQLQRHRTLRYSMLLRDPGEFGYYVPKIVKNAGEDTVNEWLNDIMSVAYCVPQGTLVRITEQGLFEDFALKCKERMCGRAQLEIMLNTDETLRKFINNFGMLSYSNLKMLYNITELGNGLETCARCKFKDFKCTEGCRWGATDALTRKV